MAFSYLTNEEVAKCWDRNAHLWTEQVRKGLDVYREYFNNPAFLKFVGDVKGKTILDAGCGEGYNTRILARRGAKITGVDISERFIELAVQEEEKEPLGIHYHTTSFSDLSMFQDASFDMVVSFMALMDGADYKGGVREIFRVLKPGCSLIFSISHPCFMTKKFEWLDKVDDNATKLIVSEYFCDEPWIEEWRFSKAPISENTEPFQVPTFPRTLSYYINTLIQAGFVLQAIEEPRPTEEAAQKYKWLRRWRNHAALFLYIRAEKP